MERGSEKMRTGKETSTEKWLGKKETEAQTHSHPEIVKRSRKQIGRQTDGQTAPQGKRYTHSD